MNGPKRSLRFANLRSEPLEGDGRNPLLREFAIERAFLLDQFLSNRRSFDLHRVEKLLNAQALLRGEMKLVREFEDMERPGVSVQLASKREAQRHLISARSYRAARTEALLSCNDMTLAA